MRATAHRQVLTGIILAGGKASRMGGCGKAFLKIGKETLIEIQLRLLKKFFKKIIIVTNSPYKSSPFCYIATDCSKKGWDKYKNLKGIKIIFDIIPNQGPLGGIYSGLLASEEDYNFVVACDMPYINLDLIKYMYKKADGFDVVVPKINNRYEPLFGIYSKNCLEIIKKLLDKKIFKISQFFSKVKVREIGIKEILRFGESERLFMNINTQKDLKALFNPQL